MCVAEISEEDTVLHEKGMKKFSDIHSVSFKKDHMVLNQYYDRGCGITEPYGTINFIPAIAKVKPFSAYSQNMYFIPSTKKKWQKWSLCNLLFCSEIGCDRVFENKEDLETQLIKGCEKTGDNDASRSFMDNVKVLLKLFTHHINILLFPTIKFA